MTTCSQLLAQSFDQIPYQHRMKIFTGSQHNQIKDPDFYQEFESDGFRLIVSANRTSGILVYDETVQHLLEGNELIIVYSPRIGAFKSINRAGLDSEKISFYEHYGISLNRDSIHERLQNIVEYYRAHKTEVVQKYLTMPLPPKQVGPDEFLARFKPPAFFHFTDKRNIPSIREHGLCSLCEISNRGISVVAPGGNDLSQRLDRERGLDRFVHLGFHSEHPMEYDAKIVKKHIQDTVFIQVSPDVIKWDGVRFTPVVANSNGCQQFTLDKAMKEMDFPVIYDGLSWRDPSVNKRLQLTKKYEVLIPNSIPPEYLTITSYG
jgi:hypothetical protein